MLEAVKKTRHLGIFSVFSENEDQDPKWEEAAPEGGLWMLGKRPRGHQWLFPRDWAAWEEEVATGIGPVNPDMPTSTHEIACHPFSSPSCTKDPGSDSDRSLGHEDSKHRPSISHFM